MTTSRRRALAGLSVLLASLGACAGPRAELEELAKDWCRTIRAGQVIPVYPLSEDLRPGDVFIVELPVQRQAEIYAERGFLPLDRHVARLDGIDWADVYEADYFDEGFHAGPKPRGARVGSEAGGAAAAILVAAPRAAFPAYGFELDRRGGLLLPIPLRGLMLGFSFIGAERVSGTVHLKEAFTYGAPADLILARLEDWYEEKEEVRRTLAAIRAATPEDEEVYLRVVSRVYLVGGLDVSLLALDEGEGRLGEEGPDAAGLAGAAALNEAAARVLPEVSVTYSFAGRRGLDLHESFASPLVVGYAGFDLPILAGGELGPPVATLAQVEGESPRRGRAR